MFENDNTLMMKALNDMLERNYDKAEKRFKKLARKNNAQALYWLGEIYVSKDYRYYNVAHALSYFEKAAQLGYVLAMSKAGNLYFNNDYQKAIYYYRMGANNNDTYCLNKMGYSAANFNGDSHDYAKAIQYFAATLNDNSEDNSHIVADSANVLGQMYWNGIGVDKNQAKAFQYFEKAASLKNSKALFMIGTFYHYGAFKDKDLNKAIQYYSDAYHLGYIQAGIELVRIYVEDLDDKTKAKEIIDKLCDEETLDNDEILQIKYYLARVSPKDVAIEAYFEIVSELANRLDKLSNDEVFYYANSCYELGNIFIENDMKNAIMSYEMAARAGHQDSLDVLTKLYQQGQYDNKLGLIKEDIKKIQKLKKRIKIMICINLEICIMMEMVYQKTIVKPINII